MIRNHIKLAWRNLKRKKRYTAIHIVGLFTGICFAMLIGTFVWQEYQVNKNLKNAEQQYILTSNWKNPNMGVDFTTLAPLAERLKENYPQLVANYYRWDGITSIISNGTTNFREGIKIGDENMLEMYGFQLLHGNPKTVFKSPYSVLVKSEKALKLFGKTDVIGNTVSIQNFNGAKQDFTITGVLAQTTENSIIRIRKNDENGFFIGKRSASYFDRANFEDWKNPYYVSHIELKTGVSPEDLEGPIQTLINIHTSEAVQKNLEVLPIKLTDYYLEKDNSAAKRMIYVLSLIGLFIVFMAMINFINISISHSGSRMREIGIRKVLGGQRRQLITQFLTESIALVAIATLLACLTYSFLRPWFGQLIGKELVAFSQLPTSFIAIPFIIVLILGTIAGLYPAFVLSSFKSTEALKGRLTNNLNTNILRKTLLGFQYITALVVLIAAIVVSQQVQYFFEKDLGFTKEFVITAPVPRDWTPEGVEKMKTIRDVFEKIPSVQKVSLSYIIPDGGIGFQTTAFKTGEDPNATVTAQGLVTDESYLDTYEISVLAGRYFSSAGTHFDKVVINKKAMNDYGFKNAEDAIGKQLSVVGEENPLFIQGVIADFHFESMQQEIKPQIFFSVDAIPNYRYLSFKLNAAAIGESIQEISREWANLLPESSFEYTFIDETLAELYAGEIQFKKAANTATILALLIALLGIFGMVALSIDKRIKEIGIRKVLGASVASIGLLFMKEFLIILIVSVLVACPIGYWFTQNWLQNYAYQITVGIDPFLIAILLVGSITAVLVVLQTLKIALTNPVESLKTE
jgi:putative ABC transport system permease protein